MSDTQRPASHPSAPPSSGSIPRAAWWGMALHGAALAGLALAGVAAAMSHKTEAALLRTGIGLSFAAVAVLGSACALAFCALLRAISRPRASRGPRSVDDLVVAAMRGSDRPPHVIEVTVPTKDEALLAKGEFASPLRLVRDDEMHPVTLPSPRVPVIGRVELLDLAVDVLTEARRALPRAELASCLSQLRALGERATAANMPLLAHASEALEGLIRTGANPRQLAVALVGMDHVVSSLRRQEGLQALRTTARSVPTPPRDRGPHSSPAQSGLRRAVRSP